VKQISVYSKKQIITIKRTMKNLVQETNKDYMRYTNLDNGTNHDYKEGTKL
jgi:hypothetical protein